MKNQQEIYEALLAGKKIQRRGCRIGAYLSIVGGDLRNDLGKPYLGPFGDPNDWIIYEKEPFKAVFIMTVRNQCHSFGSTNSNAQTIEMEGRDSCGRNVEIMLHQSGERLDIEKRYLVSIQEEP